MYARKNQKKGARAAAAERARNTCVGRASSSASGLARFVGGANISCVLAKTKKEPGRLVSGRSYHLTGVDTVLTGCT